jgi:acetyl-CoA C-acetyltransferase
MDNAVILSACRTPIGSFGGALKDLSASDLGAIVIREAIARAGIKAAEIGDVIMGCVLQSGVFDREIVPVEISQRKEPALRVTKDEYPRAGTTAATLATLRPAFTNDGTVTAGNASGINDGAAALVVATRNRADDLGKKPLARIRSYCTTGVEPKVMGMGPVQAMRKAADRAGLSLSDLDLIELNEAFASQSLAVVRELGLDPAKVNVHGGAIALGHPIGASGARILTTLVHSLQARGGGRGAASLCVGGGMGTAMIVETV